MYIVDLIARSNEQDMLSNLNNVIQSLAQQQMSKIPDTFNKDLVTALDAVFQICASIHDRLNKLENYARNI